MNTNLLSGFLTLCSYVLITPVLTTFLCMFPVLADVDLKKASKQFANHFSCGSAVTGEDEIVIQGDVTDEVIELIQKKFPQVR